MKPFLIGSILLILVLLACGCTTPVPPEEPRPPVPPVPNLLGNWSGTMTGYVDGQGFNDYAGDSMTMRVIEQKGRVFEGDFIFSNQTGSTEFVSFAGAIAHDGMTMTMVERGGGYTFATFITPDEIELIYAEASDPFNVAIDSLKRS